jgi:hypothetical protein
MKEWKIRQEVYHRLTLDHGDDLNKCIIDIAVDDIARTAIRYFNEQDPGWLYPAKSYAVAVLYSHWLCEEFNEDFISALDDPDLLYVNDPYFVPYSKDKQNYIKIIAALPADMSQGMIPDIRGYFEREFMSCNQE